MEAFMALSKRLPPRNDRLLVAFFLGLVLLIVMSAPVAAQPGFISIDCGGSVKFVSRTNLTWVPDGAYVTTGKVGIVEDSGNVSTASQTVRYFPERIPKNCYELGPVQEGDGYLIRTYFHYGNFDGKQEMPQFSLILDATVLVGTVVENGYYEMYTMAKRNTISVCLARDVSGITGDPFISTLELRPLPRQSTYNTVALQKGFGLSNIYSLDLGANYSGYLRYPNDTLDRLWWSYADSKNKNVFTMHEIVVSQEKNVDLPPDVMLQTAITGPNMSLTLTKLSSQRKYLVTMYFSEIDPNVTGTGQRVFDIYSNVWKDGSQPWVSNVDVYGLSGGQFMGVELYTTEPVDAVNNSFQISFKSSPNSTHDPIISGIRALLLTDEPLSNVTSADDATVIKAISDYYGINGSVGDPCMPTEFSWSWISCQLFESLPRITSILLSNFRLKGQLNSQFDKLQALTEIHLDGNNLTGTIPEFPSLTGLEVLDLSKNRLTGSIPKFGSLEKLKTLNLENNQLSGTIPSTLINLPSLKELFLANNHLEGEIPPSLLVKYKAGTLKLTYRGNSNLTCNGESCDTFMASAPSPSPLTLNNTPPSPNSEPSARFTTVKITSRVSALFWLVFPLIL